MDQPTNHFLIYNLPDGKGTIDAIIRNETIWATQKSMAQLFGCTTDNISLHLRNIYETNELQELATTEEISVVQIEGQRQVQRNIKFYNLDAIISVGYRVNSQKATRFRQWATKVLNDYIRKGFALDDERLKNGSLTFGKDYFRELLERIRSIRASERRIWQQITDIFAECSIDYDPQSRTTKDFYAMVQNKFHYAITGQTAAEIIISRADHQQQYMGLTTWKNGPNGRILKSDVQIAKNYLSADQIKRLERSITGFFDYIEDLVEQQNTFDMQQFAQCVDAFLQFRQYKILIGKGHISMKQAIKKATDEYMLFDPTQQITSDFDRQLQLLQGSENYSDEQTES